MLYDPHGRRERRRIIVLGRYCAWLWLLRLQDAKGKVLKTFQADFGKFTQMDFAITQSSAAVNAGDVPYQRVSLSPNPAHSRVHVELDGYPSQLMTIEVLDVKGSLVHREQRFTNDVAGLRADVDISQLRARELLRQNRDQRWLNDASA